MRLCRGRACPARGLPASARPPYTAGPGMPGPYGTATIKKRLFALCIVGWGLDPTAPPPGNTISRDGPRSGQDRSLQSNGKQAFSCSQNKKARPPLPGGRAGCANVAYSAWIAPVGQTPSQAPQSTQVAASTTALSSMVIAPTGQVSTHAPQATHSLETV